MTNTEQYETTDAVRFALQEVRRAVRMQRPTKRAAAIAAALIELPTQAEVDDFTAQVRRDAGVQDVALLPDTTWHLGHFETGPQVDTAGLLATLKEATEVRIDWPSVAFHWGVAVHFVWRGTSIVARSADYRMTETYMSS